MSQPRPVTPNWISNECEYEAESYKESQWLQQKASLSSPTKQENPVCKEPMSQHTKSLVSQQPAYNSIQQKGDRAKRVEQTVQQLKYQVMVLQQKLQKLEGGGQVKQLVSAVKNLRLRICAVEMREKRALQKTKSTEKKLKLAQEKMKEMQTEISQFETWENQIIAQLQESQCTVQKLLENVKTAEKQVKYLQSLLSVAQTKETRALTTIKKHENVIAFLREEIRVWKMKAIKNSGNLSQKYVSKYESPSCNSSTFSSIPQSNRPPSCQGGIKTTPLVQCLTSLPSTSTAGTKMLRVTPMPNFSLPENPISVNDNSCMICGMKFSRLAVLTTHITTHT